MFDEEGSNFFGSKMSNFRSLKECHDWHLVREFHYSRTQLEVEKLNFCHLPKALQNHSNISSIGISFPARTRLSLHMGWLWSGVTYPRIKQCLQVVWISKVSVIFTSFLLLHYTIPTTTNHFCTERIILYTIDSNPWILLLLQSQIFTFRSTTPLWVLHRGHNRIIISIHANKYNTGPTNHHPPPRRRCRRVIKSGHKTVSNITTAEMNCNSETINPNNRHHNISA